MANELPRRAQRLVWSFEAGLGIGTAICVAYFVGPAITSSLGSLYGVVVVVAAASFMFEEAIRWQRRMRT